MFYYWEPTKSEKGLSHVPKEEARTTSVCYIKLPSGGIYQTHRAAFLWLRENKNENERILALRSWQVSFILMCDVDCNYEESRNSLLLKQYVITTSTGADAAANYNSW